MHIMTIDILLCFIIIIICLFIVKFLVIILRKNYELTYKEQFFTMFHPFSNNFSPHYGDLCRYTRLFLNFFYFKDKILPKESYKIRI